MFSSGKTCDLPLRAFLCERAYPPRLHPNVAANNPQFYRSRDQSHTCLPIQCKYIEVQCVYFVVVHLYRRQSQKPPESQNATIFSWDS
eukprot:5080476-Pleurochrysis_carterae.AAC.2